MTEQEKLQKEESNFIHKMVSIFLIILFVIFGTFGVFFELSPSRDFDVWVKTSAIFNSVTTPFLAAISAFLLYFVWKDNRRELAETKKALTEQSDTQNFSVIKSAVFEIAEQVQKQLKVEMKVVDRPHRYDLFTLDSPKFKLPEYLIDELSDQVYTSKMETIIESYFYHMKGKAYEDQNKESQYEKILFTDTFNPYIDKIKTIALFIREVKSVNYRSILEITLFAKLSVFTWLMFVEIAFYLYKTSNEGEKEASELVFSEIAGLTCRQLKETYWRDSLSDEVLSELIKRKLL